MSGPMVKNSGYKWTKQDRGKCEGVDVVDKIKKQVDQKTDLKAPFLLIKWTKWTSYLTLPYEKTHLLLCNMRIFYMGIELVLISTLSTETISITNSNI